MNFFRKGDQTFLVPLKCGVTAFTNGATRTAGIETPVVIAVARSPVSRLRSFFVDKLRENVDPGKVQVCQRWLMHEFGYFDVRGLKQVRFSTLVGYLELFKPEYWDPHIQPFAPEFGRYKVGHVVNLDIPDQSAWLFRRLGIGPEEGRRYNKTGGSVEVDDAMVRRIEKLYPSDCEFLNNFQQSIP